MDHDAVRACVEPLDMYELPDIDLSAYRGKTLTVRFTGTENSSRQTSFVIDDTAVAIS